MRKMKSGALVMVAVGGLAAATAATEFARVSMIRALPYHMRDIGGWTLHWRWI